MNGPLFVATAITASAALYQQVVDGLRDEQQLPGVSAAVVHRGEIVFAGGSGFADLESGDRMTADTIVYVGSLSKVMTAALALRLHEQRKLSLEQRVPGIAAERHAVSVADLLTHASGLEREGDFDYWFTADFPEAGELSAYLGNAELRFAPGSDILYSNVGYAALGQFIESASGQSFARALEENLLEPLRMRSSGAGPAPDRLANGYTPPGRLLPDGERPFAGVGRQIGSRHVRMYSDARAMTPAFGVHSTARDMARLAIFLLGYGGEDVLSKEMRRSMQEKQESGWGLASKSCVTKADSSRDTTAGLPRIARICCSTPTTTSVLSSFATRTTRLPKRWPKPCSTRRTG